MTTPSVDDAHTRPAEASDQIVAAAAKVSEALECVERARGRLYDLHQLIGHADLMLDEAAAKFRDAGRDDLADRLERDLIGRNVLPGRWTFQIIEDFDDNYWQFFRDQDQRLRDELLGGRRHVYEAEMKEQRRTAGRPMHEATPGDVGGAAPSS